MEKLDEEIVNNEELKCYNSFDASSSKDGIILNGSHKNGKCRLKERKFDLENHQVGEMDPNNVFQQLYIKFIFSYEIHTLTNIVFILTEIFSQN